jgi:RNA polymerase sigma factor (TIGR02999 family)
MSAQPPQGITHLLQAWRHGDQAALDQLIPLVYDELHRLAHHYMLTEPAGHPLQTTALVNEAYVRLIDASQVDWQNRAHFFAISAKLMRRILVDFGRSRQCKKRRRKTASVQVDLDRAQAAQSQPGADMVALDDALEALAAFEPRGAQVVELRFFGGLTVDETAEVLNVSPKTVKRDWSLARAWLLEAMRPGGGD